MAKAPFADFLHYLYRLYPDYDGRGDGELVRRFATLRDEEAFAILVSRHGRLVQAVCRRILGDAHAAEDCFQATFIVLARRAGALHARKTLASWLYAVAQRVALRARAKAALRRERESEATSMPRGEAIDEATWRELQAILDEELGALDEKYRAPLVLCHLEGKTRKRIAQELGWAEGTVARRLSRGCELLRQRLTRRGIALSVAALAATLTEKCAGAPVGVALTTNTTKAALGVLSGEAACLTPQALALANEAMSMFAIKGKLTVALVAISLVLGIASYGGYAALETTTQAQVPNVPESEPIKPATRSAETGETDAHSNWQDLYRYIDLAIPRPNGENLPEAARQRYLTADAKKAFAMFESKRFGKMALRNEDEEFIKKHLVQIAIEGVNSFYGDDLSNTWKQITLISKGMYHGMTVSEKELVRKFVRGAESEALDAKAMLPAKRWVIEVRGYTYNQATTEFVKDTIMANLANTKELPGLSNELKDIRAAVRNRVSFMTLLMCDEVRTPDPQRLVFIDMSYLPTLFSHPAAEPNDPKRSAKFDPATPRTGLDPDLWRPVGESALQALEWNFGRRWPLNVPGPSRTEFVIIFLWNEPLLH